MGPASMENPASFLLVRRWYLLLLLLLQLNWIEFTTQWTSIPEFRCPALPSPRTPPPPWMKVPSSLSSFYFAKCNLISLFPINLRWIKVNLIEIQWIIALDFVNFVDLGPLTPNAEWKLWKIGSFCWIDDIL